MRIREAVKIGSEVLEKVGISSAAQDARRILAFTLGTEVFSLYCSNDIQIENSLLKDYFSNLEKRYNRMPLDYIMNKTYFMSLSFQVNRHVMIPRPETELLVERVLPLLSRQNRVLDMGTGCGNIAISLARYCGCRVFAVDIAERALELAKRNAVQNKVESLITFLCGDMYHPLKEKETNEQFDLIISNPPYVRRPELSTLSDEVRYFEPRVALDGGEDGLKYYRVIAEGANDFLGEGGHVAVEVGYDQAQEVSQIFSEYLQVESIVCDYAGIKRVVIANLPQAPEYTGRCSETGLEKLPRAQREDLFARGYGNFSRSGAPILHLERLRNVPTRDSFQYTPPDGSYCLNRSNRKAWIR